MKPTQINLTPSVVNVLNAFNEELRQLNEKMVTIRNKANDLLIGIALNNNADLSVGKLQLSEDMSILTVVYPTAENETPAEEKQEVTDKLDKPKAKRKTLSN